MNKVDKIREFSPRAFSVFLFVTFIFLVVFRMVYSNPIEFNEESILKWQLGRAIFETQNWSLLVPDDAHMAHHELRWGVVIPQILLAAFFSVGYLSYYVTPILFFCLFTVFSMSLYGKNIELTPYSVLLAFVISFEPMGHVMASQMNTGAFGLLYLIAAFWCLVRYVENGGVEKIIFCALLNFFAYGAHITYLVFSAVPIAFLIIHKKDYRGVLWFLVSLGILYVIEMWILGLIAQGDAVQGRFERILETKFHGDPQRAGGEGAIRFRGGELLKFSHFFYRWVQIPKYDFLILFGFLLSSISIIFSRVRKTMPIGVWLCFYGASIYGLAVSFPIIDFTPRLSLALDLHNRYLSLFFPIASIFVVWTIYYIVSYLGHISRYLLPILLIVCLSGVFFWGTMTTGCLEEAQDMKDQGALSEKITKTYCKIFRYSQEQNIYPKPSAFIFRSNNYYSAFNEDFLSGKVALFGQSRIGAFRTFIRVQYPETRFTQTKNGWYSIDGKDKDLCVMELGQTATPGGNYRDCIGQKMGRLVFD